MHDRPARSAWRLSVVFGLVVLALSSAFSSVVPRRTCSGAVPAGGNALVGFQFARSTADVTAVFGAAEDPCHGEMVASLDRANRLDIALFIPAYAAFLALWFVAILRGERGLPARAARAGLSALAVGAALDVLETTTQLRITGKLPGDADMLHLLTIGSLGKFGALAVVAACAGVALLAPGENPTGPRGSGARAAGVACLVAAALAAIGLVFPGARGLLGPGNAIAWLAMLLHAAGGSLRRRAA